MTLNQLSGIILDSAIAVHRELGPGLLESAYEACLLFELHSRGIAAVQQLELPVVYRGVKIDAGYKLDLLVESTIVVELKSVDEMNPIYEAQLFSYPKLSRKPLGLFINFNVTKLKDGFRRMACPGVVLHGDEDCSEFTNMSP